MSRVSIKLKDLKKTVLTALIVGISFVGGLKAFAADNVLQAIQIEGVKDSYDIILKSDDSAELKKTIQAPNKMILTLKGIRASKSINTIYSNTSTVDSVVVEPTGDDSVKILIQAANVGNAQIKFDTLKTPLGFTSAKSVDNSIVLSGPVKSYTPVYNESGIEEEAQTGLSLGGVMASSEMRSVKKVLKNGKISWMVAFGLFTIVILNGIKSVKGKDSDIKVGLSQSLRERELDLSRSLHQDMNLQRPASMTNVSIHDAPIRSNSAVGQATAPISGVNYGLKAYQNNSRSPYMSVDSQRPRQQVAVANPTTYDNLPAPSVASKQTLSAAPGLQRLAMSTAPKSSRAKTTNIDSMKFLESMTKIYEKNGRSDLAQGLKSNMKKAKANIA